MLRAWLSALALSLGGCGTGAEEQPPAAEPAPAAPRADVAPSVAAQEPGLTPSTDNGPAIDDAHDRPPPEN